MKKYLSHIFIPVFLLVVMLGTPNFVHAQNVVSTILGDVVGTIVAPISLLILRVTSLLTILSGGILNFVVDHTIVKMAENYKNITAISGAWGTVRDVANMGFIFILLYASIQMILGEGKDTRKLIVNMIVAALLINFSLFFTQIVIDASNIIALTFYHAIAPTAVTGNWTDAGLSNSLMAPMHFETIWDMKSTLSNGNIAVIGVMGSVITLIAAFIFFAVALMLVIRYVVLILVLILSPIAFIGDVIPGASGYAADWRKALFGQAFFAPVYMFLTWITIKLFNDSSMFPTSQGKSWASAFGGEVTTNTASATFSGGSVALVFNFVVIIVFLIATLILSKKVSDSAGQGINKLTSKALGLAGGATLGVAGRIGRSTFGRAGQAVADNQWLREKAPESRLARLALSAGKKTGGSSFDMRGTALGGELSAGKAGGKGGYKARREEIIKGRMKQAEDMKDVITGGHVENEMAHRQWGTLEDIDFLRNQGLTGAQISSIQANGLGKKQVDELGLTPRQAEDIRSRVQEDLIKASDEESARRQKRFLNNLSQTRYINPNLYSGVSEDAEAARRMRAGLKATSSKDALLEALKKYQTEDTPTPPTPPTTP